MNILLLISLTTISININASVYIKRIINNTSQGLMIRYNVPTNIVTLPPGCDYCSPQNLTSALSSSGVMINPFRSDNFWNIYLGSGKMVDLHHAYIPTAGYSDDHANSIFIMSGSINSIQTHFGSIRVFSGNIEKVFPSLGYKAIPIIQATPGKSYTLSISQVSDELYRKGISGPTLNPHAIDFMIYQ